MSNNQKEKPIVPVFFGFDQRFAMYAGVAIKSLIENTSKRRRYEIHVLHTDVNEETQAIFQAMCKPNVTIEFNNVKESIGHIIERLPVRDYYSASTYFRIVIARDFPQYSKALYLDSDMVILRDVAKLFDNTLSKNQYVGGVPEAMSFVKPIAEYFETCVGVKPDRYFNAGMMLINCDAWRRDDVLGQFVALTHYYDFVIAQDQDYLNVICKGHFKRLPRCWNMECARSWHVNEHDRGIIHYAFDAKPWHDINCLYGQYFWKYASMTPFYPDIKNVFAAFTAEQLAEERNVGVRVTQLCIDEIKRPDHFMARRAADEARAKAERNAASELTPVLAR